MSEHSSSAHNRSEQSDQDLPEPELATHSLLVEVVGVPGQAAGPPADHYPEPGVTFTFGRAVTCTVCLDADDVAISRVAGMITWDGRLWWLANASSARQLAVVDEIGLRRVLAPGRRTPVEGRLRVLVDGTARSHELVLHGPPPAEPSVGPAQGMPTSIGQGVLINDADRLALVALFAGYLEKGPRYDPNPRSYAAAAKRLNWPRTTLVKRIEYLRTRLDNAGVPNMHGWNALTNLAEYVLTTGLITEEDLRLIGR